MDRNPTKFPRRPLRWYQFSLRTLLIGVTLLAIPCWYIGREVRIAQFTVVGQPSWFAVGPEVYQEEDAAEAEKEILSVRPEPRWFVGSEKAVSKAAYDAYWARFRDSAPEQKDGHYFIPNPPPYPKQVKDVPLEDHGVSLGLDASAGEDPTVVLLKLKLESKDGPIERQVEHRWTNTLPFLFAFYVDGQAVAVPSTDFGKFGGVARMSPLVDKGGTREWSVRVNAESLRALLPDTRPHTLAVAAAFANTQHEGYFEDGGMLRDAYFPEPQPILVRSAIARLRWDGTKWEDVAR